MTKYILFDENGFLSARYDSAIHGESIPTEVIAVNDSLFYQTINEQDGIWSLVDGEVVKKPFPGMTLAAAKVAKLAEIKKTYLQAADAPVEALGFIFDGGFESAIKLDAAMRLSQAAGAPGVIFYDASNIGHELGFADALQVCIAVAVAYQTALGKKQSLYTKIETAQTMADLELIVW